MLSCVESVDLEKHFIPTIRSFGIIESEFKDLKELAHLMESEPSETLGEVFDERFAVRTKCNVLLTYSDSTPSSEELQALKWNAPKIRKVIEEVDRNVSIILPPGLILPVNNEDIELEDSDFPKEWEINSYNITMGIGFEFLRLLGEFRFSARTDLLPILRNYYQLFQEFDQMDLILKRVVHFRATPEDSQKIEIVSVENEETE